MSKLAHSNQETMNKIESQSCKYQDIEDIVVAVIDSNVESVAFKETVGHCAREIIAAIYAHSETDAQPVPVEPDAIAQIRKSTDPTYFQEVALLYIDSLQFALQRAHTERENWQETARQYAGNSDYWRERAEKAEALNKRMVELMKEIKENAGNPEKVYQLTKEATK